jgi:transcriptional regulator with XRE-family HTH domain
MPMNVIWREPITPNRPAIFWGSEIKRMRQEQNLSQRQLARLAEVDRASLMRFEHGRSPGTLALVEKLAAVLGYELDMVWIPFDQSRGYTPLPRPDRDPEPSGRLSQLSDFSALR